MKEAKSIGEHRLERLLRYKTAYSPMYQTFVGISGGYLDARNEPILCCRVLGHPGTILFRESELKDFVF